MKPATRRAIVVVVVAISLSIAVPARAKFDPAHRWSTVATPHFVIHFHESCAEIAARAARIAEEVHGRLAPRLGWEPQARTRLVIVDDYDEANGYASPYPYNQIVLFLAQPLEEPGFGTVVHDDWLRLVITHEYTHVLQLDMVAGLPRALRRVFGRLYFPNAFQPEWLIEGLATYEETELTSGGRGRSPGAEMVLRMAAIEGPFPTPAQMSVFPDRWPAGQVPYLFGESFIRFIAEKYGREKLAALSRLYSGRAFPFLVESTGRRVFDEGYRALWQEWVALLRDRYREQAQKLEARGLTDSTPLTTGGYSSLAPAWSPDGTRLAWLQSNADEFPGVWVMNADGTGKRRLAKNLFSTGSSGASLAWSPDGSRVYYTKLDFWRSVSLFNDLYAWDFRRDEEIRITRGLRARDPHPSPDGAKLLFVTVGRGATRLAVLDLAGRMPATAGTGKIRHLTDPSPNQYANPRWSPDGSRIAVSVWEPGGDKDIWLLDPDGRKIAEIAHDRALDGAPAWSPDGRRIFLSSDRSGVFNIYAWEVGSGALLQVSNVLGGAFSPAPSPDGRNLALCEYGARGYDIRVMALDPASWRSAAAWQDPYPPPAPAETAPPLVARPYSPFSTLAPRLWMPWVDYNGESGLMLGFTTAGQDAVQRHLYYLTGLYGPSSARFPYQLDYYYNRWRPTLHLAASDLDRVYADFFEDEDRTEDYTERECLFGADLTYPVLRGAAQHSFTLGYRFRDLSNLSDLPPWEGYAGASPAQGDLGSMRLSWLFNDAERYRYSISPENGRTVVLGIERFQPAFGSEATFTRYTGDWIEYLALPRRHHVLQARVFAGVSTGKAPAQGAYQLGGDNAGDVTHTLDDRTVHLRGYPANAFHGEDAVLASLEYRFPVLNIERGPGSAPFFLRRLHGAIFFEAGNAWDEGKLELAELKKSIGAEARLDLTFSYYIPLTLRAGLAFGMDEKGEVVPAIGLWVTQGIL